MERKVLIDLDEYNGLVEFKQKVEGGYIAINSSYRVYSHISYVTLDEFSKQLLEINHNLDREYDKLKITETLLRSEISRLKKRTLFDYIKELIWKK